MEYRSVGSLSISRISLGCWAFGGHGYGSTDDRESIACIQKAKTLGVCLFDTADVYGFGHSESLLARALSRESASDCVIATKGGVRWDESGRTLKDSTPKYLANALDDSLTRLGVSAIDLYQLHWTDDVTPIEESLDFLFRAREKGKVREVGISNSSLTKELMDAFPDLRTNQSPYNFLEPQRERQIELEWNEFGVSTLAYGCLARGMLSGKYERGHDFGKNDTRANDPMFHTDYDQFHERITEFARLADGLDCSRIELALAWCMRLQGVCSLILGAKTVKQVSENVAALDAAQKIVPSLGYP